MSVNPKNEWGPPFNTFWSVVLSVYTQNSEALLDFRKCHQTEWASKRNLVVLTGEVRRQCHEEPRLPKDAINA